MIDIEPHVVTIQLAIAYTLLGAFIFTVIITCLSLIGIVKFEDKTQQNKLFTTLIIELVVIAIGIFSSILNYQIDKTVKEVQKPVIEELVKAEEQSQKTGQKLQNNVFEGLRPEAAALARQLIDNAKILGIEVRLISGYRSKEQQQELYSLGRTKPGNIVTHAKFSAHNTGLAFDVAIIKDGKYDWNSPDYSTLGTLGKQLGLIWGGDNKNIRDVPHFETESAKLLLRQMIEQEKK